MTPILCKEQCTLGELRIWNLMCSARYTFYYIPAMCVLLHTTHLGVMLHVGNGKVSENTASLCKGCSHKIWNEDRKANLYVCVADIIRYMCLRS